jgi:DEAD/DEAH box helicase domain-containing protein
MLDVEQRLGHRLALDAIAGATLGIQKTADGIDAIKWWREGRLREIAEYCCYDVKVTRLVHEHGCRHGELFYQDRFAQRRRIAIDWRHLDEAPQLAAA